MANCIGTRSRGPGVFDNHGHTVVMGTTEPPHGTVALVDRRWLQTGAVTSPGSSSVFAGFRFPPEVISVAVRWYLRYGLSYRDVEELLAERGVTVDHVTIYRWVQRFTPEFAEAARPCRHVPGDRWFVDETYLKIAGRWSDLYRAVDQHGQVIDVLLSHAARPGSCPVLLHPGVAGRHGPGRSHD
jgi:DDE domain